MKTNPNNIAEYCRDSRQAAGLFRQIFSISKSTVELGPHNRRPKLAADTSLYISGVFRGFGSDVN
jgi:hypothetical protein